VVGITARTAESKKTDSMPNAMEQKMMPAEKAMEGYEMESDSMDKPMM